MSRTATSSRRGFAFGKIAFLTTLAVSGSFVPDARAGGLLDALFGGFAGRPSTPSYAYADPSADLATRPEPRMPSVRVETPAPHATTAKAFCVRLCDGRYYPIATPSPNATAVQLCSAMCPAAKTRVFHGGSEIASTADANGMRYTKLDQAFAYRQAVVPGCTCNGKDAFGLAPVDVMADPTLRAGDIVATGNGLKAFQGTKGETHRTADFTLAQNARRIPATVRERLSDMRVGDR